MAPLKTGSVAAASCDVVCLFSFVADVTGDAEGATAADRCIERIGRRPIAA